MSKRSAPPLWKTKACGEHRPYRSEHEATVKASWHLVGACEKCRAGKVWHVWECGGHWHLGHTWWF